MPCCVCSQAAAEAAFAATESKVRVQRLPPQKTLIGLHPLQTVALGQKMDLVFSIMRVHFMFGDFPAIKRDIRKARCMWHLASRGTPDARLAARACS